MCFNGEVDNLASQHKLTPSVWRLPVKLKAGNTVWLFIPSLSFSARKQLKAEPKFTLILKRALSACCFSSPGLYLLFAVAMSAYVILHQVALLSIDSHTCVLSLSGGNTHISHPETSRPNKNIKLQAEGEALHTQLSAHMYRGPEVTIEQDYICISQYFIFQETAADSTFHSGA